MYNLSVCVGSACHLKGSYRVIEIFKECVREYKLEQDIVIKGAFCLGHCTEAVSVLFEDTVYSVVPENAHEFFENTVMGSLRK